MVRPGSRLNVLACVGVAAAMVLAAVGVAAAPLEAAALTTVTGVSAGVYHSCAVLSDGSAECWGRNDGGEIGDGTVTSRSLPVAVMNAAGTAGLTGVADISVGATSCTLMLDTTVRCWGDNFYGELGIGTKSGPQTCNGEPCSMLPVEVQNPAGTGPLTGVTQISVGDGDVCAVLTDTSAACWGNNLFGMLSDGHGPDAVLPAPVITDDALDPLTGISSISAGGDHTCAVLNDATAPCWGHDFSGQLGDGTTTGGFVVVKNSAGTGPLTSVMSIAAGSAHTCAVLTDHTVRCWGQNSFGQLGDGTTNGRRLPVPVLADSPSGPLTGATQVVAGGEHSCALLADGSVRCWGIDGFEQLGTGALFASGICGEESCSTTATAVQDGAGGALTGVADISSAIGFHSCARMNDGSARCWGQNTYVEIGDGTAVNRCLPVTVGAVGPSPAVPDAPTGVSATSGTDRATIQWSKQTGDCGTPVTKFTVTASPGGQQVSVGGWTNAIWATSAVFPLTPGPTYTFTVTATDDAGTSAASASTNPVKPVGEPSAPAPAGAVPGNARATIKWKAPLLTNGAPITGYSITPLRNGVPDSPKFFGSAATSAVFTGLKNGVAYTFKIAAINQYGTGPQSKPTAAIRVGSPVSPTNVKVSTKKTPRSLIVSYQAGANNGAPITKFTATCTSANGGVTRSATHAGSAAVAIAVAGVTATKTYSCTVTATNSHGIGAPSIASAKVVA